MTIMTTINATVPKITPESIDNEAQNKPGQIAYDLLKTAGVPTYLTYYVLLKRGVFKWLSVRRHLIKLKDSWRKKERMIQVMLAAAKKQNTVNGKHVLYVKGYQAGLRDCRLQVRGLCHSPRWQVQDNDHHAQRFLTELMAMNYRMEHTPGQRKNKGKEKNNR